MFLGQSDWSITLGTDSHFHRKASQRQYAAMNPAAPMHSPDMTPKGSQPVPKHAPRDTITQGRFTFIKGVRLRDYDVPRRDSDPSTLTPSDPAFQCKDAFSEREISLGSPQQRVKIPRHVVRRRISCDRLPPTPPVPETRSASQTQLSWKRVKLVRSRRGSR